MKTLISVLTFILPLTPLTAQEDLALAENDFANGQFQNAIEKINREPGELSPSALMLRADCLHKLGQFNAALNDYDRAKINGYDKPDLLLHRGICRSSAGSYDSAMLDFAACLEYDRGDAKPYYWMAHVEYMMMDNKAALRYLNEALFLDSTYKEAYFLRGAVYAGQGKTLYALEDFKSAFRIDPSFHKAKFHVATLTMDLGLYEQSKEILTELLNEDTDFKDQILYYRGWCMYSIHDSDGACSDWVESAGMGNADSEESHRRACLNKVGKPRLKRTSYARF